MNIGFFIAAVFAGNVLTLALVWGVMEFRKFKDETEAPWLAYAAVGLPIAFAVVTFIAVGGLPPSLDAIAAR